MSSLGLLLDVIAEGRRRRSGPRVNDDALADVGDVVEPETLNELSGETGQAWDAVHRSAPTGRPRSAASSSACPPRAAAVHARQPSAHLAYGADDLADAWQWFEQARALWTRTQGLLAVIVTGGQ